LTISPGADMALVVGTAVRYGQRAAFVTTLRIVSGLAVHASGSALGLLERAGLEQRQGQC
jgi:threonine/homoserine/homoserine lactone efflux protein